MSEIIPGISDDVTISISMVAIWLFMGLIGWGIGRPRGRDAFGFLMGALLGPIGWIITLCMPRSGRKCPACLGVVPEAAIRCCHCGSLFSTFRSLRR